MVFCPPQEGKSQKISRRTPAWLLSEDPTLRIAIVSYSTGKAERWGRQIRRDIQAYPKLDIKLRQDSRAAARWETEEGGGLIAVGLDSGITGEPVDVMIIDDPVRGRKEAESAAYRKAAWDWWENNGSTRLSARGRVILMMTRWHEDDLAGRLLAREPGVWKVLRIPAIADSDNDPLGRRPGEELVSVQGRAPGYFKTLQKLRTPYAFQSVYQQKPSAAEGMIFKKLWWRYWRLAPQIGTGYRITCGDRTWPLSECYWRFATVDLAASKRTSADYTVVSAWAITLDGDLLLLDRARARIGEEEHFGLARPLVERWRLDTVYVEESMISSTLVREAARAGLHVQGLKADTDKVTRALPAADRVKAGRVWLPSDAPWLDSWREEHASFPAGTHDDQVDTLAYAVRIAVTRWTSMPAPPPVVPAARELDLMTVPL